MTYVLCDVITINSSHHYYHAVRPFMLEQGEGKEGDQSASQEQETKKQDDAIVQQKRALLQSILRYGRQKGFFLFERLHSDSLCFHSFHCYSGIIAPVNKRPENRQTFVCAIAEDKVRVLHDVVNFWSKITKVSSPLLWNNYKYFKK